jgi:3-deoxy-manno-octulosonate cytidylyltransferase (CMP-KDO synthetase)
MHRATPPPPGTSRIQRAVAIIPARLGSTRLSRKMLLRETGRYLFEHTARNLLESGVMEQVVVATDSEEIERAAGDVGLEVLITQSDHQSGTDRVFEAWNLLVERGVREIDVVVNVQGDEPDVAAEDLRRLIASFEDPEVEMATLWAEFDDPALAADSSSVKVVLDSAEDAMYFSRAAIPDVRHMRAGALEAFGESAWKLHIGVYAFRPHTLRRFCELPPGKLERIERLEQLRWLEAGGRLRVIRATHRPRGIDTAEDYAAFVARVENLHPPGSTP